MPNTKLKEGVRNDVSIHALGHSFNIHLLKGVPDLSIIQKLLGRVKTTLR